MLSTFERFVNLLNVIRDVVPALISQAVKKRHFHRHSRLTRLLFFVLIIYQPIAQSDGQERKCTDRLSVAVPHYPPWNIVSGDKVSGINAELLNVLARSLNFRISYVPCPFARCLRLMAEGQTDIIVGLFRKSEREQFLNYIEPPFFKPELKVFYLLKEQVHKLQQYTDLYSLTVGVTRGISHFEPFDSDDEITKSIGITDQQNFQKLLYGRVDVVITTEHQAKYLMERNQWQNRFL